MFHTIASCGDQCVSKNKNNKHDNNINVDENICTYNVIDDNHIHNYIKILEMINDFNEYLLLSGRIGCCSINYDFRKRSHFGLLQIRKGDAKQL